MERISRLVVELPRFSLGLAAGHLASEDFFAATIGWAPDAGEPRAVTLPQPDSPTTPSGVGRCGGSPSTALTTLGAGKSTCADRTWQ